MLLVSQGFFFRLMCTTEDALLQLESKLSLENYRDSSDVLQEYFIKDSVKFQSRFSPYSNSLYLKSISNFNILNLNQKDCLLKKKSSASIHIVSISSDVFTPKENIAKVFDFFQGNGSDVSCYEFDSEFGHEAWIVDGGRFYEFSKNNNLF